MNEILGKHDLLNQLEIHALCADINDGSWNVWSLCSLITEERRVRISRKTADNVSAQAAGKDCDVKMLALMQHICWHFCVHEPTNDMIQPRCWTAKKAYQTFPPPFHPPILLLVTRGDRIKEKSVGSSFF